MSLYISQNPYNNVHTMNLNINQAFRVIMMY